MTMTSPRRTTKMNARRRSKDGFEARMMIQIPDKYDGRDKDGKPDKDSSTMIDTIWQVTYASTAESQWPAVRFVSCQSKGILAAHLSLYSLPIFFRSFSFCLVPYLVDDVARCTGLIIIFHLGCMFGVKGADTADTSGSHHSLFVAITIVRMPNSYQHFNHLVHTLFLFRSKFFFQYAVILLANGEYDWNNERIRMLIKIRSSFTPTLFNVRHMMEWFSHQSGTLGVCPTGCLHQCAREKMLFSKVVSGPTL